MKTISLLAFVLALSISATAFADDPQSALFATDYRWGVSVGKSSDLTLRIVPKQGYHWNKDYPAKIVLKGGQKVAFGKLELKKATGEIKDDEDKAGVASVSARGVAAGDETIDATMSFSVCNKDTCQLIRERPVKLTVTVK